MAKKITIQQASVICYTLRTHEEGNGTLDISICQLIGEEPNTLHIEYWRDMGGQYGRCYRDEVVPMDAEISWDEQKRQVVHCPPSRLNNGHKVVLEPIDWENGRLLKLLYERGLVDLRRVLIENDRLKVGLEDCPDSAGGQVFWINAA